MDSTGHVQTSGATGKAASSQGSASKGKKIFNLFQKKVDTPPIRVQESKTEEPPISRPYNFSLGDGIVRCPKEPTGEQANAEHPSLAESAKQSDYEKLGNCSSGGQAPDLSRGNSVISLGQIGNPMQIQVVQRRNEPFSSAVNETNRETGDYDVAWDLDQKAKIVREKAFMAKEYRDQELGAKKHRQKFGISNWPSPVNNNFELELLGQLANNAETSSSDKVNTGESPRSPILNTEYAAVGDLRREDEGDYADIDDFTSFEKGTSKKPPVSLKPVNVSEQAQEGFNDVRFRNQDEAPNTISFSTLKAERRKERVYLKEEEIPVAKGNDGDNGISSTQNEEGQPEPNQPSSLSPLKKKELKFSKLDSISQTLSEGVDTSLQTIEKPEDIPIKRGASLNQFSDEKFSPISESLEKKDSLPQNCEENTEFNFKLTLEEGLLETTNPNTIAVTQVQLDAIFLAEDNISAGETQVEDTAVAIFEEETRGQVQLDAIFLAEDNISAGETQVEDTAVAILEEEIRGLVPLDAILVTEDSSESEDEVEVESSSESEKEPEEDSEKDSKYYKKVLLDPISTNT